MPKVIDKWKKEHLQTVTVYLNKETDADISEFLSTRNKNDVLRRAIRMYIREVERIEKAIFLEMMENYMDFEKVDKLKAQYKELTGEECSPYPREKSVK